MVSRPPDPFADLDTLQQVLGLSFRDKSLLLRALTHRSFLNESPYIHADNERLEFLGDAVLDLVVAEVLYQRFPEQREGPLTAMRANLVRRETLARFARNLDLGHYLRLSKGEDESGGRERDTVLCAAFESLCGAIYLDGGMAAMVNFLRPMLEPEIQQLRRGNLRKDAKSRLQEWAQAELNETPYYVTVGSSGPDHAKTFNVEVRIADRKYGAGRGNSKQRAAQAAAQEALKVIAEGRAHSRAAGGADGNQPASP